MKTKHLSLSWELDELEAAVSASRILCDGISQIQFATEIDAQIAPRAASAVLTLVGLRLRLVRRVLQKLVAADLLAGPHNTVELADVDPEEPDVLLPLESSGRHRAHG
jgi:hypothetical protein